MAPRKRARTAATKDKAMTDQEVFLQSYNTLKLSAQQRLPFAKWLLNESERSYGKSSLLAMPPEIKEKIFAYAVVEPSPVEVYTSSHRFPGLLETCPQIREIALPLYWKKNQFNVHIYHYDGARFELFYSLAAKQGTTCNICFEGNPHWDNLIKWAMLSRERRMWRFDSNSNFTPPGNACLPVLSNLIDAPKSLTAKQLLNLANGMRRVMVSVDARWAN